MQRIFRFRGWDGTGGDQRLGKNLHFLCNQNEVDRGQRSQSLLRRRRIAPCRFFHNELGGRQFLMLMSHSPPFTDPGLSRRCEYIATGTRREV